MSIHSVSAFTSQRHLSSEPEVDSQTAFSPRPTDFHGTQTRSSNWSWTILTDAASSFFTTMRDLFHKFINWICGESDSHHNQEQTRSSEGKLLTTASTHPILDNVDIVPTAASTPASVSVAPNSIGTISASPSLETIRDTILSKIRQNRTYFDATSIPETLQGDRSICLALVQAYGRNLQFIPQELRSDREIVEAAVRNNGSALQYALGNLDEDEEIVKIAVSNYGLALRYACKKLQENTDIVLAAVTNDGLALEYASDALKTDKKIVSAAVQQNGKALRFAGGNLNKDEAIVMLAVQQNGMALGDADQTQKDNEEIVKAAIKNSDAAIHQASRRLQTDRAMQQLAFQVRNGQVTF